MEKSLFLSWAKTLLSRRLITEEHYNALVEKIMREVSA